MRAAFFLEIAVVTATWLANPAAAEAAPSDLQHPFRASPLTSQGGKTLSDCAPSITECANNANVKIITAHNSTTIVTRNHTVVVDVELSTEYVTVTQINLTTVITDIQGRCRDTTIIYDAATTTITVDANVTTTREIVPIETITTVSISTILAKATEQCLVGKPHLHIQSAGGAPLSRAPPAGSSLAGGNDPSVSAGDNPSSQSIPSSSSHTASTARGDPSVGADVGENSGDASQISSTDSAFAVSTEGGDPSANPTSGEDPEDYAAQFASYGYY